MKIKKNKIKKCFFCHKKLYKDSMCKKHYEEHQNYIKNSAINPDEFGGSDF